MSFWSKSLFAIAALCLVAGNANAITIDYLPLDGLNVMYIDIAEDTRLEPEALFGAPDIVGNTMDFDPLNFVAQAENGGSETVDGQLNFTIMSKDGFPIDEVIISERGDYSLNGLGIDVLAEASVAAPVEFTIIEVDGAPPIAPINGAGSLAFSPSAGIYELPGDLGTGVPWIGFLELSMDQVLADAGVDGRATKVEFSLENTLSVATSSGGSALIAKKDSGVSVTVPEPSSISLLGFGVLLALRSFRRK